MFAANKLAIALFGGLLFCSTATAQFSFEDLKKKALDEAAKQATQAPAVQPKPAAAPVAGKPTAQVQSASTSSDPFVSYCKKQGRTPDLYDCDCLGAAAPAVRAEWVASKSDSSGENMGMINYRKNQLRVQEEQLATTTDPTRKASLERSIAKTKEMIAELESPDPMGMSDSVLMLELASNTQCRKRAYLEAEEMTKCKKSASFGSQAPNTDAYCGCVGKTVADDWVSGRMATYNSKTIVNASAKARFSCND